jgi:hypothetical protein
MGNVVTQITAGNQNPIEHAYLFGQLFSVM